MKITLSFPSCGTDIPYFDSDEFDPNERHEYVDLRSTPGDVDDLPEMLQAPQFKEFLLAINGQGTIFRTFGCNFRLIPGGTIEIGPPIPPSTEPQTETYLFLAESYVHVGFADIGRCENLDDYYRLCGRLSKHLSEQAVFQCDAAEPDAEAEGGADVEAEGQAEGESGVEAEGAAEQEYFHVELGVESLRMDGRDKGHVLAITCEVLGWTEEDARQRWSQLMSVVSAFLATEQLAHTIRGPREITEAHRELVQAVKRRAFEIWGERDHEDGRALNHWMQARHELGIPEDYYV